MQRHDTEERLAWLRERQRGIGATDISSLCGVGFSDAETVYAEKTADEPVDSPPNPVMAMGLATEPHNAALYAARTGARLISPGLMRSESNPWQYATYDRLAADKPEFPGRAVELKYTPFFGDEWGSDGTDDVRDGYIVQATWQTAILRANGHNVSLTDISAIDGYGNHRVYPILFNESLAAILFRVAESFWRCVESRAGLARWESPAEEVATRLLEIRPNTSVVLGTEAMEIVHEIDRLTGIKRDGEACADAIKNKWKPLLAAMLGGAAEGKLPDGRRVTQKIVVRKPHQVQGSQFHDLRILSGKKEKLTYGA